MLKKLPISVARRTIMVFLIATLCVPAVGAQQNRNGTQIDSALLVTSVRDAARPLAGVDSDYDALMKLIGNSRFVLLGEATHGTHEFYRERARITQRLIKEKGFNTIVLEADFPDTLRVNAYIGGAGADRDAAEALSGFKRFPRWMWRNTDVRDLVERLRAHNDARPAEAARVRIHGMDLYSLPASADRVISYLKRSDADAARRARKRYGCFSSYRLNPSGYGDAVAAGTHRSCEREAQQQFDEMQRFVTEHTSVANRQPNEELLYALQHARVVKNAEEYYRTAYRSSTASWNLRDHHMVDTVDYLVRHSDALGGGQAKVIVWAHNSHLGDARATEASERGELNVGQLMRQRYGNGAVLVGFTTYTGKVRAAREWGGSGEHRSVLPSLAGSYGALFHETGVPNFLLLLRDNSKLPAAFAKPRLERAIGVIYLPQTERQSHYFRARLSQQFDAVIHFDVTSAVEPLK
jgi:erythromycin esterase-like protein